MGNFFQIGGSGLSYFEGLPPIYQRGYGYFTGYPVYRQKGNGLGDIFRSLWRVLKPIANNIGHSIGPIAKQAGQAIGQEGIATTSKILNKIVEGSNPTEALITEGKEAAGRLFNRANVSLQQRLQKGSGKQRVYKKNTNRRTRVTFKPSDFVGRTVSYPTAPKKQRRDTLGFY